MARIGERLVAAGKINATQLRTALAYQARWRCRLGEACVALGIASATEVLPTVAQQLHVPYIYIGSREVPARLLALVPAQLMRTHHLLPVRVRYDEQGRGTLFVATADPGNLRMLDEIGFATGKGVRGVLASRQDLEQALRRHGILEGRPHEPVDVPEFAGDFVVLRDHQAAI